MSEKNTQRNFQSIELTEADIENIKMYGIDGLNKNVQSKFDVAFDRLTLPSKGRFYPNDSLGNIIDYVDVAYINADDESTLLSDNLLRSGKMIDVLIERKTKFVNPMTYKKLLVGDRIAILLWLRATMEPIYKLTLIDPDTNTPFSYDFNLTTLKEKEIEEQPNQDGYFDFKLPKSGRLVTFRLMTVEDEDAIQSLDKKEQMITKSNDSFFRRFTLERMVIKVEGINDSLEKSHFLRTMNLMDARALHKHMNHVMPSFDLNIEIPTPSGGNFRTTLPFTPEFFYPAV